VFNLAMTIVDVVSFSAVAVIDNR
jgi:hypothetical protein